MKIFNQWRSPRNCWGISLLGAWGTADFFGIVILGFNIEIPRTDNGRAIHALL